MKVCLNSSSQKLRIFCCPCNFSAVDFIFPHFHMCWTSPGCPLGILTSKTSAPDSRKTKKKIRNLVFDRAKQRELMTYAKWQIGHVFNSETNSTGDSFNITSAMYKKGYALGLFIPFLEENTLSTTDKLSEFYTCHFDFGLTDYINLSHFLHIKWGKLNMY